MTLKNLGYYFLIIFSITNILLPEGLSIGGVGLNSDYLIFITILLYAAIILIDKRQRERFLTNLKDFSKTTMGRLILVVIVIMFISVTYSREKVLALKESIRFCINVFILFTARYDLEDNGRVKKIIIGIYGAAVLAGIYGIVQHFTLIGLAPDFRALDTVNGNRITSTFGHPNTYGAFLILILLPMFMLIINSKKVITKVIYSAIALLLLVNIIFTFSRNAWLALAIGFFILAIYYNKKLIIPFILVVVLLAQIPMVNSRIKDITDMNQNSSRIKHWTTAAYMIKDHTLLGVGNGNYVSYYDDYIKIHPELDYNNERRFPVHNSYLKSVSELGIIGSMPFIALLFTLLWSIAKDGASIKDKYLKAFNLGFFAAAAAFLCMNFVDNLLFVPEVVGYFWMFVGISRR